MNGRQVSLLFFYVFLRLASECSRYVTCVEIDIRNETLDRRMYVPRVAEFEFLKLREWEGEGENKKKQEI